MDSLLEIQKRRDIECRNSNEIKDHDLLSFSSLLVRKFNGMSTGLTLLGALLDDSDPHLRVPRGSGNFFQVTLMEAEEFL